MDSTDETKLREYHKNQVLIPIEHPVGNNPFNKMTAFRTTDKEVYIRDGINGSIQLANKKIRGKANKKKAKRNRRLNESRTRLQRNTLPVNNAIKTKEPETIEKKKETTEELIIRLKGMIK